MKKPLIIAISLALFLAGAVGGSLLSRQWAGDSTPQPIPDSAKASADDTRPAFSLPDLQGNSRHISEWDGNVLVLNFWASWCGPCRREIPAFNQLQARYASQGVQFVGVAIDDTKAVKRFMEDIPIDYPVLIGDSAAIDIAKQFGNQAGVLPYTVFIDRRGEIVSVARGAIEGEVAERTIKKLL